MVSGFRVRYSEWYDHPVACFFPAKMELVLVNLKQKEMYGEPFEPSSVVIFTWKSFSPRSINLDSQPFAKAVRARNHLPV